MKSNCLLPFTLFCLITLPFLSGCSKTVPQGKITEGEVALTFDDSHTDSWYKYLPLLDSLNIKATFYISNYRKFTPQQKEELHAVAAHGHEIAFHTTNHPDLVKVFNKQGIDIILKEEIEKGVALLQQDGFQINNFAYPYGSHNAQLDIALLKVFKSIRAVGNPQNSYYKCMAKDRGEKQLLYGADIDEGCNFPDSEIIKILDNARSHHNCAVLLAHDINNPKYKFSITVERLRMLAKEAEARNLKFITINQLAQ
jgi:peptidoglycan/xylan/chitin deacetylase (PgdA/CDA1 family)